MQQRTLDFDRSGFEWPDGCYVTQIPSINIARHSLGPSSEKIRRERSAVYWSEGTIKNRGRLRLGMHDRGEEYIFADGQIHPHDRAGHLVHFPAHVKVIKQAQHTIRAGEIFDVTATHSLWPGVHMREELYVYVHFSRLVVEPGAVLKVRGNIFVLSCDELILAGNENQEPQENHDFEIQILGTDYAPFSKHRRQPARKGKNGHAGAHGQECHKPYQTPSIFGPLQNGGEGDCNGKSGDDGQAGEDGTHGQNGGMAMLADLRIGRMTGFRSGGLHVFGQAGQGYAGGDGGNGGEGGSGGNSAFGAGGAGGQGGNGGCGGHGGNGGLASHIFLTLAECDRPYVTCDTRRSLGGAGGKAGEAGSGGLGGRSKEGGRAKSGAQGTSGVPGRPGRGRNGPKIHIFSEEPNSNITAQQSSTIQVNQQGCAS